MTAWEWTWWPWRCTSIRASRSTSSSTVTALNQALATLVPAWFLYSSASSQRHFQSCRTSLTSKLPRRSRKSRRWCEVVVARRASFSSCACGSPTCACWLSWLTTSASCFVWLEDSPWHTSALASSLLKSSSFRTPSWTVEMLRKNPHLCFEARNWLRKNLNQHSS